MDINEDVFLFVSSKWNDAPDNREKSGYIVDEFSKKSMEKTYKGIFENMEETEIWIKENYQLAEIKKTMCVSFPGKSVYLLTNPVKCRHLLSKDLIYSEE